MGNTTGYMNKLFAVVRIKWTCIIRNASIMVGPILTVGMVWMYKVLYGSMVDGELPPILTGIILSLGISMNICMDGFMMVGMAIAEEKEKHTLRVLMTSSVTGAQYFVGSILFPFVITVAVNFVVLLISQVSIEYVSIPAFFLISVTASLISCVLGMIVGICASNQMNASLIAYPLLMVFMMIPILGNMSEAVRKVSGFLFTGVLTEMTDCFANETRYVVKPLDVAVLVGELIISVLVFLILYKKNGYEKD